MKYWGAILDLYSDLVPNPTLVCLSMKGLFAFPCVDPLPETGVENTWSSCCFPWGRHMPQPHYEQPQCQASLWHVLLLHLIFSHEIGGPIL